MSHSCYNYSLPQHTFREVASRLTKRLAQAGLFFDGGGWRSALRRHPLGCFYHESEVCQGFPRQRHVCALDELKDE